MMLYTDSHPYFSMQTICKPYTNYRICGQLTRQTPFNLNLLQIFETSTIQMPSQESIPPFPLNLPTADIHTVDFAALTNGSKEESRKVYEAATGYGFFYLSNHGVDYNFSTISISFLLRRSKMILSAFQLWFMNADRAFYSVRFS